MSGSDDATQQRLDGQVAIVTGGGRGIGRAIAEGLARAGAAVTVLARSEDELAETVRLIESSGGWAIAVVADVTDERAVQDAVERTERELGPVDLLVNNAAVATPVGPAWEVDPDAWWRTVEVNLRGPFLGARAVLPSMLRRRAGRIVNIVAVAAFNTAPFMSAYGGSKAALISFTDDLAAETREHGISVFAIRPGLVQTRMQDELMASPYVQRRRGPQAPALVPADRAAEAVVFVATGKADALSGRFVDVTRDEIAELAGRADEIRQNDLFAMRLRT
ncbi:MAG TPA: SDR family oxidoreductase [Chloroflexota bacterium]|nr:SDR family oxidoreductase [Chloroflexota bacterium]